MEGKYHTHAPHTRGTRNGFIGCDNIALRRGGNREDGVAPSGWQRAGREAGRKSEPAVQALCRLWPAVLLAQEMGMLLERGEILLGPLPLGGAQQGPGNG